MDKRKLANVLEFPTPNVSTIMAPLDPLRHEHSLAKIWNKKHETAFNNLKKALLSDIVLSYPDMNHGFCISVDASASGIGVVLFQKINGVIKHISFMAKSLSKSERKYSATYIRIIVL